MFNRLTLLGIFIIASITSFAGQMGHYHPGIASLRDFIMPPKGVYYLQYDPYYYCDAFYGSNGKKTTKLQAHQSFSYNGYTIDANGEAKINFKVETFAIVPLINWVTDITFLNARFGGFIAQHLGYENIKLKANAVFKFSIQDRQTPNVIISKNLKIADHKIRLGDLLFVPVWLSWHGSLHDFWIRYGFYVPIGTYNKNKMANIGFGFWSQTLTCGGSVYLQKEEKTAFILDMTYEINQKQRQTHITPGQYVIFEYGISHMAAKRLELVVFGSSLYQVTKDSGKQVNYTNVRSYVNALGVQVGYWAINEKLNLSGKCSYEYMAKFRTKGILSSLNLCYVF